MEADRTDDTQVALTVDVRDQDGAVTVESNVVRDDGYVFKEGPGLRVSAQDGQPVLASFDQWIADLKEYLQANREYFIDLLS